MQRGEVWWARLPPPIGRRPVLLLSRDAAYSARASFTVAPITTQIRGIDVEVRVGRADGLRRDSVVNLDDIQTIHHRLLDRRITLLSDERMGEVERAIKFALDLD